MKSNKIMKEIIDKDFNQTENYLEILSKTTKRKKSNKYKIVLLCSCMIIVGIATFQYLPKTQSNSSDAYFLTSIRAEEKVYDGDEKIVFNEKIVGIEYPVIIGGEYNDEETTTGQDVVGYCRADYRMDLKITGENIEKVIFKVISDNPKIELYHGVSGELQYREGTTNPNYFNYDAYPHASKIMKDLTYEEIQLALELGGYNGLVPEDLNNEQLFNLLYDNTLDHNNYYDSPDNELTKSPAYTQENMLFQKYEEMYKKSPIEADKLFGHFNWDFVEQGKEITLLQKDLNSSYMLYLAGTYGYGESDKEKEYLPNALNSKYTEQLVKDTKIEIDIVYKNGTVKKKTLSYEFKDLGRHERGYFQYELQGTLQ